MALAQRWTAAISVGLVMGALLACKKKPDVAAEASATASAPPAPAASAAPAAPAAPEPSAAAPAPAEGKLGDVKRYGVEKESKLDEAGVRVAADELKVFNEADIKTDDVATLPKGLLVFRQVKMDDFTLVEFPSGVGQFSRGWVETKGLSTSVEKVTRTAALSETKTATVKVVDGGAPAKDAGKVDEKKAADTKAAEEKKAADAKAAEEKKAAEAKAAAKAKAIADAKAKTRAAAAAAAEKK
jgi:colicin import membrane protein